MEIVENNTMKIDWRIECRKLFFEICTLFSDIRTFSFRIINYPKNSKVFQKFFFWNCKLFQKFLELQTIQKKLQFEKR